MQLLAIYFVPLRVPAFVGIPDSELTPLPSGFAVGSEELARDIARQERRLGGPRPGDFLSFLYHEHDGPHFGSVESIYDWKGRR